MRYVLLVQDVEKKMKMLFRWSNNCFVLFLQLDAHCRLSYCFQHFAVATAKQLIIPQLCVGQSRPAIIFSPLTSVFITGKHWRKPWCVLFISGVAKSRSCLTRGTGESESPRGEWWIPCIILKHIDRHAPPPVLQRLIYSKKCSPYWLHQRGDLLCRLHRQDGEIFA